jgi:hypothetical protein
VEKKYIFDYLQEIKRVLSVSGEAFIHLPHNSMRLSREGAFTNLSDTELVSTVEALFSEYSIDKETLKHGCILTVTK